MGNTQKSTAGIPGPFVGPNGAPVATRAPPDEPANPTRLVGRLADALAQRYPFLDAPPPDVLDIGGTDAGLMAWAIMVGLNPDVTTRPLLAQWLGTGRPGGIEAAADPLPPPIPEAIDVLMERGISALGEMARSGSLEDRLAEALVPDWEETPLPLTGGVSVYRELTAALDLFDASISASDVLASVAASLPADFGAGSTGGRATIGYLFDDVLAQDDFYLALPGTLTANFDLNEDGFTYVDDSFRGTAEPVYADGARIGAGGYSGGALRVALGGIDDADIIGMSGGWERPITLTEPSQVSVTFRYQLTHSSDHENDEYAEVLVSLDGILYGSGANDYIARITGDGNGGPDLTTGWQVFTVDFGQLAAGTHSLIIGGYSDKKTYNNESTEVLIDEVTITDSGPLIVGQADGLLANDVAGNGLPLSVLLQSGPSNGIISLGADGSFIYTPDAYFLGVDSFVYRASDALFSDSAQVTIEVGNVVQGSGASESLVGTAARDALLGLDGDDTLSAAGSDDRLTGGSGADLLTGGDGADIFAYDSGDGGAVLALADTITDFDDGIDFIGLSGNLAGLSISGGGLTLTDDGGGNAVVTVVSSGEILSVIAGAFGVINDADFIDV